MYRLHMLIGNFSQVVFESEDYYEIQDNLEERWSSVLSDLGELNDSEYEMEYQNFMSYFIIEEV